MQNYFKSYRYFIELMSLLNLKRICLPRFIKFIAVGIFNTIFSYALYAFFLFIGTSYIKALFYATIASVIFNYFSYGNMVFVGDKDWTMFFKFFISYLLIYSLNSFGLSILINYYFVNPYVGQVICIVPCVLMSWLLMNYLVFKRL